MRSHEERITETKRRIAKIEQEKRLRHNMVTMASAVAACLVLLIGASFAMPGIAASIQAGNYAGFETAASKIRYMIGKESPALFRISRMISSPNIS